MVNTALIDMRHFHKYNTISSLSLVVQCTNLLLLEQCHATWQMQCRLHAAFCAINEFFYAMWYFRTVKIIQKKKKTICVSRIWRAWRVCECVPITIRFVSVRVHLYCNSRMKIHSVLAEQNPFRYVVLKCKIKTFVKKKLYIFAFFWNACVY